MTEWYLKRIPKVMFGYWMTEEFPWVRYLTLATFRRFHPNWKMILYRTPVLQNYGTDYKGKSYWNEIDALDIEVRDMDVEQRLGITFPLKYCTIFSDTMRYIALDDHGGFYIDLDNLFYHSLEDMPWNIPDNEDKNVFILEPPYHHIILGVKGANYYNKVSEIQKTVLSSDPSKILDTTGCTMNVHKTNEDRIVILPLITTEENFDANGPKSDYALALNWHGSGSYGKYQAITEENYMTTDHPLAACIRYCLHGDMGMPNGIGTFEWIARGG